ncbi:MAG: Nif3-like dinuclear metal center hexameric protein, partial [Muribaculaceae bacterium]|nr:Nif3-like dinuclear metal center hexameric protein [Muribaculaceae bacterium]
MLKVKDIAKAIEDFAPLRLKEDWDNPGLQVGDPEMGVTGVLLCLDVTEEILQEACKRDCNMIISHHPLIFGGLKRLTGATPTERIVAGALLDGIAVYSAHTNLDSAFEGVSYEMAHMLGMKNCYPLERSASGDEKE